jgi:broad specificity phosphatase PhoE
MELCIIRHGQSTNNALADPRNRVCDPPLTELGGRQAEIVAQHLATGTRPALWVEDFRNRSGCGITRLYCSPMWRALQTAQYIGQTLGLAPQVWIDIHERGGIFLDHGEEGVVGHPGKTRSEILAEFPGYVLPEGVTDQGWWRQQGREDMSAFYGRAAKVTGELRQWAASDERIALVTHGGFTDALLKALFNQLPGHHIYYHHLNTAISWISFRSDGHLDIEFLNRVDHLPLELVS